MTKTPADLLERNVAWAAERVAQDPDYFSRLTHLQQPEYLWIGCSDSRVPANVITGLEPGEVFVHRNVANLVHSGDLNLISVLQFSIDVLKVSNIIVCGHYNCGGVHAAVEDEYHGTIDHWLQPIRDVEARERAALDGAADAWSRHTNLCELSVKDGVAKLARNPFVQGAWRRGQALAIHGWVYSLEDGLLKDLDCTVSGQSPS